MPEDLPDGRKHQEARIPRKQARKAEESSKHPNQMEPRFGDMDQHEIDLWHMRRALEMAVRGQGFVEPNPMVGCVIAQGAEIIGEGFHRRFGGPTPRSRPCASPADRAAGATLYVTLEPCCHQGKTPPCTQAVLASGVRRVVVAQARPLPAKSRAAASRNFGLPALEVEVGLLEAEARRLNAPYLKLVDTGRPWIIAKWAMTLDGKIATRTGESRWISNPQSRQIVHALRGRVDAIMVGRRDGRPGRSAADRPAARPAHRHPRGSRHARLAGQRESACAYGAGNARAGGRGPESSPADRLRLRDAGCEVFVCEGETHAARLDALLAELGRRRLTNVLVEGGGRVAGQPVGRPADRRSSRLHRAETARRRHGRHADGRRGNRRRFRGAAIGSAAKCGKWATTRTLRPDARRIVRQEIARAASRVIRIGDGSRRRSGIGLLGASLPAAHAAGNAARPLGSLHLSHGSSQAWPFSGAWAATAAHAGPRTPPILGDTAGQPGQNDHCQQREYRAFHSRDASLFALVVAAGTIGSVARETPSPPSSDIGPTILRVQKIDKTVAFDRTCTA